MHRWTVSFWVMVPCWIMPDGPVHLNFFQWISFDMLSAYFGHHYLSVSRKWKCRLLFRPPCVNKTNTFQVSSKTYVNSHAQINLLLTSGLVSPFIIFFIFLRMTGIQIWRKAYSYFFSNTISYINTQKHLESISKISQFVLYQMVVCDYLYMLICGERDPDMSIQY